MRKIYSLIVVLLLSLSLQAQDYVKVLNRINTFFETFDGGYYGHFEIKDGILYNYFQSGKYASANMADLTIATEEEPSRKVILKCKDGGECVYSTYTDSYHAKMQFSTNVDFNTRKLIDLFNELIRLYNGASDNTAPEPTPSQSTRPVERAAD